MTRPLLMIPGPIEISPAVHSAYQASPPSHVSPPVIEAFGSSLQRMREVWRADAAHQPFIVSGSGTVAMDMAISNVVDAGDRVLLVNTGYFSDRIGEMAHRRGATVEHVRCKAGFVPTADAISESAKALRPTVVIATHVDTSTGVRVDIPSVMTVAREHDALTVFDGVCATAGEAFEMKAWGADIYLTASQKAIGLPPGLALLVASERALERRERIQNLPSMILDFAQWLPVMKAYEARKPSYFATPATNLILALDAGLGELTTTGIAEVIRRHQRVADAMRAAWKQLGLTLLGPWENAANTLSAIRYPEGVDASLVATIGANGAIVAGGLHPEHRAEYFRVGHMGYTTTQRSWLVQTVRAVEVALNQHGHACGGGVEALVAALPE
jgi:alanine-glyoxylate transaminase/serine-glyoxylate transaminase/serine-pyruvate transaminase